MQEIPWGKETLGALDTPLNELEKKALQNLYDMIDNYDRYLGERKKTNEEICKDPNWHEIREYANVMINTLKKWVPITYEAFMDYRVGGMELSSKGKSVVKKMINGEKCKFEDSGLSKREWNELMEAFNLKDKLI